MSGLLNLITAVDNVPLDFEHNFCPYYRLFLAPDPRPHGYVHPDTVSRMPWPSVFTVDDEKRRITLQAPPDDGSTTPSAYTNAAFQQAVDAAVNDRESFPTLNGLHSEPSLLPGARYPVQLERFATSLFGATGRGSHLTAYTRDKTTGQLRIWVARRSKHLYTYPGMLDSTVAGGIKASDTPLSCILAEAHEEASLSASLVESQIQAVGVITLSNHNPRTQLFHSEILYLYDLELSGQESSDGQLPRPGHDDEVEDFILMSCEEVRRRMLAGEFKPNVCAVMIDFLLRHGEITPEGEGDYVEICSRLRRRLPVPVVSDMLK